MSIPARLALERRGGGSQEQPLPPVPIGQDRRAAGGAHPTADRRRARGAGAAQKVCSAQCVSRRRGTGIGYPSRQAWLDVSSWEFSGAAGWTGAAERHAGRAPVPRTPETGPPPRGVRPPRVPVAPPGDRNRSGHGGSWRNSPGSRLRGPGPPPARQTTGVDDGGRMPWWMGGRRATDRRWPAAGA